MIITPKNRVEARDIIPIGVGVEGWFTLKSIRRNGEVRRHHKFRADPSFKNLILNNGMNNLFTATGANTYTRCRVGTGTTTPHIEDTGLSADVGPVGGLPDRTVSAGVAPNFVSSMSLQWISGIGDLGNNNLTEIMVGGSTSNTNAFSRALIQDSAGNPVAFPISEEEQLQVTYELLLAPPLEDAIHEVQVGATTHDVTVRALGVNAVNHWAPANTTGSNTNFQLITTNPSFNAIYTGGLGAITATSPQGSSSSSSARGDYPYVSGSFQRDSWVSWDISTANGSNRTSIVRYGCCAFQMEYNPPIVKTSDQILRLEYRVSADRV